jgi:hypothetical protein
MRLPSCRRGQLWPLVITECFGFGCASRSDRRSRRLLLPSSVDRQLQLLLVLSTLWLRTSASIRWLCTDGSLHTIADMSIRSTPGGCWRLTTNLTHAFVSCLGLWIWRGKVCCKWVEKASRGTSIPLGYLVTTCALAPHTRFRGIISCKI